jgi:hypothetical protein
MDAHGHAESGLEQMLWAYLLGQVSVLKAQGVELSGAEMHLSRKDLSAMFIACTSIEPTRAELDKWMGDLNRLLPFMQNPKVSP